MGGEEQSQDVARRTNMQKLLLLPAKEQAMLQAAGEAVKGWVVSYDAMDAEIADLMDDNNTSHAYFYRPYDERQIVQTDSPWAPQVSRGGQSVRLTCARIEWMRECKCVLASSCSSHPSPARRWRLHVCTLLTLFCTFSLCFRRSHLLASYCHSPQW